MGHKAPTVVKGGNSSLSQLLQRFHSGTGDCRGLVRLIVSSGLILSDNYVAVKAFLLYTYISLCYSYQNMFYSIGSNSISLDFFQFWIRPNTYKRRGINGYESNSV